MVRRIFAAMLIASAFLPTMHARAAETGSDGKILNGMAPLYVPFPAASERAVSAELTLPKRASNTNWYSNWVMVVGTAKGASHTVFVQVGMIRRPGQYDGIHVFTAWQGPDDSSIHYSEYQSLSDAPHAIGITETKDGFDLLVDMKPIGSRISLPFATAYAQVGPEVYAEGDTLVGSVRNITITSGSIRKSVSGPSVCRYVNHGVELVPATDGSFAADGVFLRNKPSRFLGDCSGI